MDNAHDRMVKAASQLLSLDGMEGTSLSTVLAASDAPRGSIYHHFPQGKDQLISEAVTAVGDGLLTRLSTIDTSGPEQVVLGFAALWRELLVRSRTRAGCAVAAVAVSGGPALQHVAGTVFESWLVALSGLLEASGLEGPDARRFAGTLLAAIEGALVIARAESDLEPFDRVVEDLVTLAHTLSARERP